MVTQKQIDRLLKKETLTGVEVGKILVEDLVQKVRLNKAGQPVQGIYTKEKLDQLVNKIMTAEDVYSYLAYDSMRASLFEMLIRVEMMIQQNWHGQFAVLSELRELTNADIDKKTIDSTPVIMTLDQFKRLKEEAVHNLEENTESLCSLIFKVLDQFLKAEDSKIEIEAPAVHAALNTTKNMPATSSSMLKAYINDKKYDLLPGLYRIGSNDELRALFYKGPQATRDYVRTQTGKDLNFTDEVIEAALDRLLGDSKPDDPEIAQALDMIAECFTVIPSEQWPKDPPEDLKLYDLLDFYVRHGKEENTLNQLKNDAPEVYNTIKAYIEQKVPQARDVEEKDINSSILYWRDLAKSNLIGFSRILTPSDRDIVAAMAGEDTTKDQSLRQRAAEHGITIAIDPHSSQIDVNGDYVENTLTLDSIYDRSEKERETQSKQIGLFREQLICDSFRYIYAFNDVLGILADIYKVPDLKTVLRVDTALMESSIDDLNEFVTLLYRNVYGSETEKQAKRSFIKKTYPLIDVEELKPSKELIAKEKKKIRAIGVTPVARFKLKAIETFVFDLMQKRIFG